MAMAGSDTGTGGMSVCHAVHVGSGACNLRVFAALYGGHLHSSNKPQSSRMRILDPAGAFPLSHPLTWWLTSVEGLSHLHAFKWRSSLLAPWVCR